MLAYFGCHHGRTFFLSLHDQKFARRGEEKRTNPPNPRQNSEQQTTYGILRNMEATTVPLILLCLLCGGAAFLSSSVADTATHDGDYHNNPKLATRVQTLLCDSCTDDATELTQGCQAYITPLNTCYNAQVLFPNDDTWGKIDIYDTMIMRDVKRVFYESTDGSCVGKENDGDVVEDYFMLPLDECVGPFGPPRPWGKFSLLFDDDHEYDLEVLSTV